MSARALGAGGRRLGAAAGGGCAAAPCRALLPHRRPGSVSVSLSISSPCPHLLSHPPARRRDLAATGRTVGQLSEAEAAALRGGERGEEHQRAHSRLMLLLDLAHRMGLLASGGCMGSMGRRWARPEAGADGGARAAAAIMARPPASASPTSPRHQALTLLALLRPPTPTASPAPAVVPVGSADRGSSIGGATASSTFAVQAQLVLQDPPAQPGAGGERGARLAGRLAGWLEFLGTAVGGTGGACNGCTAPAAALCRARRLFTSTPAGPPLPTGGAPAQPPAPATTSFDLTGPGALAAYWAHLQYLATRLGCGRTVSAGDPLGACFPFDRAPEVGGLWGRRSGCPAAWEAGRLGGWLPRGAAVLRGRAGSAAAGPCAPLHLPLRSPTDRPTRPHHR